MSLKYNFLFSLFSGIKNITYDFKYKLKPVTYLFFFKHLITKTAAPMDGTSKTNRGAYTVVIPGSFLDKPSEGANRITQNE